MRTQRTTGTAVELAIRSALHRRGLRYRVDQAPLPGLRRRADIVFRGARVAVMVDGCFWHSCPIHATRPKSNAEWWAAKLEKNVERDRETDHRLRDAEWLVLRVWEHVDPVEAAARIEETVRRRGMLAFPTQ